MGAKTATEICLAEQETVVDVAADEDLFGQPAPATRGRGRPKGAQDRETREWAQMIRASGKSPLAFLVSVYGDDTENMKNRLQAASAALPYVHKRMPQQVEVQGAAMQVVVAIGDTGVADADELFSGISLNLDPIDDAEAIEMTSEESEENQ